MKQRKMTKKQHNENISVITFGMVVVAVGIILAGGNGKRMKQLSEKRAVAAMPIAGSYRSIDFVLSNMTNSHIQKVAVFTL